jgi:integrase
MGKILTDALVRSLDPPRTGRSEVSDLRAAGLSIRISSNGTRSWCFRFRDPRSGKTSRSTIGEYPTISLSDARQRAEGLRRLVASGKNPVAEKRLERVSAVQKTFQVLAHRYLNEHAQRRKRSADADERNLRLHVLPKWRDRRYDEIERGDIIELVEGLVKSNKPTLANRVQALVSSIYSFALDAGLVKAHPGTRLRRRGTESIGRRVLSDDEIRVFWSGVVQTPVSPGVGLALRLALLTGARPGEVAGLMLAEIENLNEAGTARWIIPAKRSKNGRAHFIPLSELARQQVLSALELINHSSEHLFPSPSSKGNPITPHALAVAMARFAKKLDPTHAKTWVVEPPTPHDLRRTLATRLAELGIAKEDRDAVFNHTPPDVGKKHYDLYERAREKRIALDLWASTLAAVLATGQEFTAN